MNRFFSVCIPTTNRGITIYNCLCSLARQSFRDFEVIIVDCGSDDSTRSEIERFFNSEDFRSNHFDFIYETRNYVPQTVEDWNEPLKLATGKYIAMLEGDDSFLPDHLQNAYNVLSNQSNIGFYAEGNQNFKRRKIGVLKSKNWLEMAVALEDPAPPSEAIFVRTDMSQNPFLYNAKDYEYAPECDLYVRIALKGYDGYHSEKCGIIRDRTYKKRTTWHYVGDRFTLLKKYKECVDPSVYQRALRHNTSIALRVSIRSKSISNMLLFAKMIIKKTSFSNYLLSIPYSLIDYLKYHR